VIGVNEPASPSQPASAQIAWVAGAGGSVPPGALSGGAEPGRPHLYIGRGQYQGGVHPGKVVGQNCNIGWGGREILLSHYEVLVAPGAHAQWIAARGGQVPPGAVSGGGEPGRPQLYVCRGQHQGGVHPGKLVGANCNIGWGGKEILLPTYQVLVLR